jgi:hypothetical protein
VDLFGPGEVHEMYLADKPDAQLTGIERLARAFV